MDDGLKWTAWSSYLRTMPRTFAGWGSQWWDCCQNLFFPAACVVCSAEVMEGESRWCPACFSALQEQSRQPCPRCARPLPQYFTPRAEGCFRCRHRRWHLDQSFALGFYRGRVRDLVLRLKQADQDALGLAAGTLLADRVAERNQLPAPDVVLPVPMHWWRRLMRGSHAAEVLAESLASTLRIPLRRNWIRCRRWTRKQGTLTATERAANVRGAYRITGSAQRRLSGAHVLLVDDVLTTGSTANELASVLRRQGASHISVAVVARGLGLDW